MIEALEPREVQVVPGGEAGLERALGATARRLAGRSIGLVLSGGGARAFAHLGVLDELRAQGIQIDRYAGASMGSIVVGDRRHGRHDRRAARDLRPLLRAPEPEPRLHAARLLADPRRAHAEAARRGVRRPPDRGARAPLLLRLGRPVRARARRPPHRPGGAGGLREPRHPRRLPAGGGGRRPPARRRRRDEQPPGRGDGGHRRGPDHRGRRLPPRRRGRAARAPAARAAAAPVPAPADRQRGAGAARRRDAPAHDGARQHRHRGRGRAPRRPRDRAPDRGRADARVAEARPARARWAARRPRSRSIRRAS